MRFKLLVPLGLVQERWHSDRQWFMSRAKELGAEVSLQVAAFDEAARNIREGSLKTQRIDVLVVISSNDRYAPQVVDAARREGIPVIAYDRMINDCDLDLYLSFDNVKVGELQAGYLVKIAPAGNYLLIGGPPEDANARLCRQGQMNILQPFLDRGTIQIAEDKPAKGWQPMEALKITREALDKTRDDISAVVASNDGTAGGAIQALEGRGLAGKVPVSGQDADLAACQRIARGSQSMTVYKPVQRLAIRAAEAAMALGKKEPLGSGISTISNGRKDVPCLLLDPITVERKNLADTVIADGFHRREEIFQPQ